MTFTEIARVFEWIKGEKTADGEKKTKSAWKERYYGKIELNNNVITTLEHKESFSLEHQIQSSMNLKPAFNCNRAWIYRYKLDADKGEVTYALRFKKPELAEQFKTQFESSVTAVKDAENEEQKKAEEAKRIEEEQRVNAEKLAEDAKNNEVEQTEENATKEDNMDTGDAVEKTEEVVENMDTTDNNKEPDAPKDDP